MRHLIKKILKEDIFQMDRLRQLEEGDSFIITKVNQNLEECDPDAVYVLNPLIGKVCKVITTDWDVNLMDGMCEDHYGWGALIMSEDMVGGHDLSAKGSECKRDKCYWVNDYYIDYEILDDVDTDEFFGQLDEQEEDDFGWADEILSDDYHSGKLIPGNIFRCQHDNKEHWNLDVMVIDVNDTYVEYISKVSPNGELLYHNKKDFTTLSHAEVLIKEDYWLPINKSQSLFNDYNYNINESEEDDFGWADNIIDNPDCEKIVIVTSPGGSYSSYLNAMAELDIPVIKDMVERLRVKYNVKDVTDTRIPEWNNGLADDHYKILMEFNNTNILGKPEKGDVCCLYPKSFKNTFNGKTIKRLIRISDGKNFIINDNCYKDWQENISESKEDDFGWAEDTISNEFDLGPLFRNSTICYGQTAEDHECKINLTKDYFVFKIDFDWWLRNYFNDNWILESLIKYGYYDYDNDWYGDDEEFNYVYFYLNQDNKDKIEKCLTYMGKSTEDYNLHEMFSDLMDNFNHIKSTDYLISDTLSELNSALNRNRNASIQEFYQNLIEETAFKIEFYSGWRRDEILVKAPNAFVLSTLNQGYNLSQVFDKIIAAMDLDQDWDGIYFEEYNTSGAEEGINKAFDDYLDDLLEKLEGDESLIEYVDFIKTLPKLGFTRAGSSKPQKWYKTIKNKGSDYVFVITNINAEKMELILRITVFEEGHAKHRNYKYKIGFDELGSYLNNYLLDIE